MNRNYTFYAIVFACFHALFFIVVLSIFRPIPGVDVAENFFWGQHFQLGYYKHPPLFAWVQEVFGMVFGVSVFTSYVTAQFFIAISLISVFFLAKEYLPEKQAFLAVLLLEGLSYAGINGRTFNADLIQIPFWVLAPLFYLYGIKTKKALYFILFGACLGLSFLGKYFTLLLGFVIFISLILNTKTRVLLKTPLPYLAVFSFAIVISPHVYWLFQNDFLPVKTLFERKMENCPLFTCRMEISLKFFFSSISTFILMLLGFALLFKKPKLKPLNLQEPKNNLLFCITVLPFAILTALPILTGMHIFNRFSATFFFFLPLFILYFWKLEERPNFKKTLIKFIVFLFILWGIVTIISGYVDKKHKGSHFEAIKNAVITHEKKWVQEFGRPLKFAAGDVLEVGIFTLFSKERLVVIPENNLNFAPYVNKEELEKNGYILLLQCNEGQECNENSYGEVKEEIEVNFKKKKTKIFIIYIKPKS